MANMKFIETIRQRVFEGVWVNKSGTTKISQLTLSHLRNVYQFCVNKGYPFTEYLPKLEYEINRKLNRLN